jgi:hypothetical protein
MAVEFPTIPLLKRNPIGRADSNAIILQASHLRSIRRMRHAWCIEHSCPSVKVLSPETRLY